ncbi:conserved hypothetical protein [Oenococcus oeni]|uniref:Uncharacterized protein n=2 Tax=Oenococcus oeni TaxID=1247 RepID=A0AAQ2USG6_OENOE|nr:hypothetical protein AWRIB429_1364 [Oenococcus oeni AWRIB429]SYV99605.1 conserved hypothetical protein [Oenococcus oeni]SYW02254.1 conserved hypothetical protein [Oenococcus oeni]SYW06350.1 conserved hypothetical protein [Oenococcus oeni]SYW10761.1 conserved hypothetical protein [Oenococcus oeni]
MLLFDLIAKFVSFSLFFKQFVRFSSIIFFVRGRGGIGRRAGLRILW